MERMDSDLQLTEAGFNLEAGSRNSMVLMELDGNAPRRTDEDDLSLGASASPTTTTSKWISDASNPYYVNLVNTECTYPSVIIKQLGKILLVLLH